MALSTNKFVFHVFELKNSADTVLGVVNEDKFPSFILSVLGPITKSGASAPISVTEAVFPSKKVARAGANITG
ncbi:hypothetical protein D3C86_2120540 [compost metagenome]